MFILKESWQFFKDQLLEETPLGTQGHQLALHQGAQT
jgi:hypothetical protein